MNNILGLRIKQLFVQKDLSKAHDILRLANYSDLFPSLCISLFYEFLMYLMFFIFIYFNDICRAHRGGGRLLKGSKLRPSVLRPPSVEGDYLRDPNCLSVCPPSPVRGGRLLKGSKLRPSVLRPPSVRDAYKNLNNFSTLHLFVTKLGW